MKFIKLIYALIVGVAVAGCGNPGDSTVVTQESRENVYPCVFTGYPADEC